jgi:hypothetical protein
MLEDFLGSQDRIYSALSDLRHDHLVKRVTTFAHVLLFQKFAELEGLPHIV